MRPEQLLLRGFASFRHMTEAIDFTDADLFALTGPTGAGKSSIIDAMCFALYGRIPRLPGNAVEPVITLGAQEARIDFSFSISDRSYRVARVVERTARGAIQREAILEGDDEPVSGADQVTKAVARLTGLSFEHFTRCVVLPQGEFAAFLHDRPANRQDLLRSLLDLEMYERVRRAAQELKTRNDATADLLERQLSEAGPVDDGTETELRERLDGLRAVDEKVSAAVDHWAASDREAAALDEERKAVRGLIGLLSSIVAPAGLAGLANRAETARSELIAARDQADSASALLAEAEKDGDGLPSLEGIDAALARHSRRRELQQRIEKGEEVVARSESDRDEATVAVGAAEETFTAARASLARAEQDHLAHALRPALEIGEPCPVCTRVVESLPADATPAGLSEAREAAQVAEAAVDQARARLADVVGRLEAAHTLLQDLRRDRAGLEEAADRPENDLIEERRRIIENQELSKRLREADRVARAAVDRARDALDRVEREERAARETVASALVGVPVQDPPKLDPGLPVDRLWASMLEWRDEAVAGRREHLAALDETRAGIERRQAELTAELASVFPEAADAADPLAIRSVLAASIARAQGDLERLVERRDRLGQWTVEMAEARRKAALATTLARELAAAGFEGWILEEALAGLVDGANVVMANLLESAYSLEIEKRDFVIVDHRNADERRPVRTLSGGETFLVSLALALALAERLATLSPAGTARLESILLDEGFGTLDGETLETVAGVLHELSASGERTVGIVTHVKELAELMPVRFLVERGPGGATVRRVDT